MMRALAVHTVPATPQKLTIYCNHEIYANAPAGRFLTGALRKAVVVAVSGIGAGILHCCKE